MAIAVFLAFVVVTALLVAFCISAPVSRGRVERPVRSGAREPRDGPRHDIAMEEMLLVVRLLDGDLDTGSYQRRMADIAAVDAVRHPMLIPPGPLP